ncbi:hypothetical protein R5R35_013349 [Gryllus longicercus]|uniref:Uncharacterized protein n=1 Tax=Gryllus longicercus TaxID=2509291 RepID=A0AAN9VWE6_9ORTH
MEDIKILSENTIKIEEIKEEPEDSIEENSSNSIVKQEPEDHAEQQSWNVAEEGEPCSMKKEVKEEDEEEELKPPVRVNIKEELTEEEWGHKQLRRDRDARTRQATPRYERRSSNIMNNNVIYSSDEEVVECSPCPSPAPQALVKRRKIDPCGEEMESIRRDAVALLVRGDSFDDEVNNGGVDINHAYKKFVNTKDCPVYVYTPPRMDPWKSLLAKAEASNVSVKLNAPPKGLAFLITQARSVVSTKFGNTTICVTTRRNRSIFTTKNDGRRGMYGNRRHPAGEAVPNLYRL